jgi:dihydroorotase
MKNTAVLKNFRLIDENTDTTGSVIIEGGIIKKIIPRHSDFPDNVLDDKELEYAVLEANLVLDGINIASGHTWPGGDSTPPENWENRLPFLMPTFVDLHAHFRDPGYTHKESLESAVLAAAAGGFGTVVCMANTGPVIDSAEKSAALKRRADILGLIDVYPVLSLTKNMEGRELSGITALPPRTASGWTGPLMLSEDGKDIADDALFVSAMKEARRIGIPVSCHCDFGGAATEEAKRTGQPRAMWSRMEENHGVNRAIALGRQAGCRVHIAHVSTKEAVEAIGRAKKEFPLLTAEATPHNIALTEERAHELGDEGYGRVNPPLRTEADRQALIHGLEDGTIDAIATDHAPHCMEEKAAGAPGFSGLETAFAVCYTELVQKGRINIKKLSSLMSAEPARILGLSGTGENSRGIIAPGYRADFVIADAGVVWTVDPARLRTRGKNTPFAGRELHGKILVTVNRGGIVFDALSGPSV